MRRRFLSILLLLCMSWQSLAVAGVDMAMQEPQETAHALLHFAGQAHHHHDEHGAFHQDDSAESIQHVMADACMQAPALMAVAGLNLPALSPAAPMPVLAIEPHSPVLPGLERPPRLNA